MTILVLSDSHSSLRFMRDCVDMVQPDQLVHLGDLYDDGACLREEYPSIPLCQVAGNCDLFRCPRETPEVLIPVFEGVRLFCTHGHRHQVKMTPALLLKDARRNHAQAALFGHTHEAVCYQEPDGLWVMNPGSAGYCGGTAGLIRVEKGRILDCRILTPENLADFKK